MYPRVLFLINSLTTGGAERVFVDDANQLSAEGWDIYFATLFAEGSLYEDLALKEGHFTGFKLNSLFDLGGHKRIQSFVLDNHIDVVYTTLNEANLIGRLIKIHNPSVRLVTREANVAQAKGLFHKLADMFLGNYSDAIAVVSKAVGTSIAKYAPWLAKKMIVLYNGVHIPQNLPTRSEAVSRLLAVGSLTEKKDHEILLRALAHLPEQFVLTIVGDGPLKSKLADLAKTLGVTSRVHFMGGVPYAAMAEIYKTHDVLVLSSKREGSPNVLLEAQSFALPVVAFSIAGIEEFISQDSGMIVSVRTAEALAGAVQTLSTSGKAHQLAQAALLQLQASRSKEAHLGTLKDVLRGSLANNHA